jgi:predicted nucleotidyltransferase
VLDYCYGTLKEAFPEVVFAYLHGSAASNVTVYPGSDLDLAFWISGRAGVELYDKVESLGERLFPGVRVDLGMLNGAEPVYRFECLKGRLLFVRDQDLWLDFYSRTCREYEHQIADYEKQRTYRRISCGITE